MRNKLWKKIRYIRNHRCSNKEELQQRNHLGTANCVIREIPPLILIQLQSTNICSVRIGVLYLICETSEMKQIYSKPLWWNKANGSMAIWSQNTRKPQKVIRWARPQTLIIRRQPCKTLNKVFVIELRYLDFNDSVNKQEVTKKFSLKMLAEMLRQGIWLWRIRKTW